MEYLAFALACFTVALAGGLVGLVLGNLRLPVTLLVASSAASGGGANLVISAVAAGAASIAHLRGGRVNWRLFAWMAPPSIVGAFAGGYLAGEMPRDLLLGLITVVLLFSAVQLFQWVPPVRRTEAFPDDGGSEPPELRYGAAATSGAVIGVLGGIVGLILGSLRMPALLKVVGEAPARAAGTNILVGVCVGVAGALGHLPSEPPDWDIAALGAAASVPGALIGSRLTGRLSEEQLVRAIAWVLLAAAAGTGVQAVS